MIYKNANKPEPTAFINVKLIIKDENNGKKQIAY
jgi:hypothetical protein